ncbi:ribonuclease HII [Methanobrevibacter filiformis]|uniref:Ribonuclease HII n=1 Tax=Methanobrevibacter filiformis TaxID=55758 RepID=A0A166FBG2_9EURY|nr:ribonuclease HII [Methanobrevibacter filiformis]KZX17500.1 ribonuclease HIII [Methanobrevibacter filiformis]
MNVLGIDEAGRGPVIGPLIVAGVIVPEDKNNVLERMGVKDSKRLTATRRKVLSRKLKNMFEWETIEITAADIDNLRANGVNLNDIEKIAMNKVIENLLEKTTYEKIIIDSLDVKPERLEEEVKAIVKDIEVKAEHKADDKYIPVAAASIIAKAERDAIIEELKKEYRKIGDIGSGYPSDPKTKKFLSNYSFNEMPIIVRKSWQTVKNLK